MVKSRSREAVIGFRRGLTFSTIVRHEALGNGSLLRRSELC